MPTLSAHAAAVGVTLAGSVIAVPLVRRTDLARSLAAAGHWVHADRIEGSYRGQAGVSVEEVHDLAGIPGIRLDVHLMVDDPSAELPGLPGGISRISLQCDGLGDLAELVCRSRTHADEVWLAVHHGAVDASRLGQSGADGVLVLLTPPGQPGHRADLDRLSLVQATCAHGLPVGVDGGVTHANLAQISASGARYAVVGRAITPASANR
jgi:pentose-5-phosphate-3-epimerase